MTWKRNFIVTGAEQNLVSNAIPNRRGLENHQFYCEHDGSSMLIVSNFTPEFFSGGNS